MPIQPIYKAGTVTVTSGSDVVTGSGTAFSLMLVNGGALSVKGLSIPIIDVTDDTHLKLAYPAPAGMAGANQTYAIELGRASVADAIVATQKLATLVDFLSNQISSFARTVLDDASASAMLTTLGALAASSYTSDDVVAKLGAASVFNAQKAVGLRGPSNQSIADDSHLAFTPASFPGFTIGGVLLVMGNTVAAGYGVVALRFGGALQNAALIVGLNTEVKADGVYTASNSTDGKLTVALDPATSTLRVVNRTNATAAYSFLPIVGGI